MMEWIVSSSVLIAVMAVLRRVLKGKLNPRLQYALWAIVLVRLLIPVSFFESGLSVQNVRNEVMETPQVQQVYTAVTAPIPVENYDRVYREVVQEYEAQGVNVEEMDESDVQTEVYSRMDTISVREVLYALWIAGMAVMAAALIGCNARFALRLRRSREEREVAYSPVPVYITGSVETPCLFGAFRPAIYLTPESAEDEQVKRYVLTHEITHYQQFDHIWAVLRAVCLVLHWYNPMVWLAFRLSRQDGEMACDEGTLMILGEEHRGNYGRTLIALATQTRLRGSLVTATTMADGKKAIKERIVILMKNPKTAFVTMIALILVCTLVVGCTFTGSIQGEIKENGEETEPAETTEPLGWQHPLHGEFTADGFEYVQGEPEEVTYFIDDRYVTETNYAAVYYRYGGTSPVIELASLDMTLTLPEEWLEDVWIIQYTNGDTGTALIVSRNIMQAHQENAEGEPDLLYGMDDYLVLIDSMVKQDSYGDWNPRSDSSYIGENETHLFFVKTCDTQEPFPSGQSMMRTNLMLKIGQRTYESLLGNLAELPGQIMDMITIHGGSTAASSGAYDALFQFDGSVSEWRAMATMCVFDDPSQIDPSIIFYNGFDDQEFWNDFSEEEQAYLQKKFGSVFTDVFKLPASRLDEALQKTFGVFLSDVQIPEHEWVYYETTDCYYDQHGDVLIPGFTITGVEESGDTLYVYYTHDEDSLVSSNGRYAPGQNMVMTLQLVDGEYRVQSNQIVGESPESWSGEAVTVTDLMEDAALRVLRAHEGNCTHAAGNNYDYLTVAALEEEQLERTVEYNGDQVTVASFLGNIEYLHNKEAYWMHVAQEEPVMRRNNKDIFAVESAVQNGDAVVMEVSLNRSYLDADFKAVEESFRYQITMLYIDRVWYVADITETSGWFDQTYKNDPDFDVNEAIAAYDAQSGPDLTADQIAQVNEAFAPLYEVNGEMVVNPVCSFFTSYFASPAQINLADFMRYFSVEGVVADPDYEVTEEEFRALTELAEWPFGNVAKLDEMPVPVHGYPAKTVNAVLEKYAGVTLDDLNDAGKSNSSLMYLPAYETYYNFTSDFGLGGFTCTGGRIYDDHVELYSNNAILTLRVENGFYYIYSHQPAE